MKKLMLSLVAATALMGLGASVGPASATPAAPAGIATPDSGIDVVRMHKRMMHGRRMRHHRMMRHRGMRRGGAMMRNSGNARNPEAPVRQQQQGQTSGGPRY